jgi:two-component system heavy metal sensor histidine kinase CusS
MMRSFKLRLLMAMILVAIVVVGANRLIASHLVQRQITTSLHLQMQSGLPMCAHLIENRETFSRCYRSFATDRLIKNLSDEFVLCYPGISSQAIPPPVPCASAHSTESFWSQQLFIDSAQVQGVVNTLDHGTWHAIRLTAHPEVQIFISQVNLNGYLHDIWKLRDDHLIYVLPTLMVLLLLTTWLLVWFAMKPINSLQSEMKLLSIANLDQTHSVKSYFSEFAGFVSVYDDLRHRLNTSFIKAKRFSSDAAHELRTPLTVLRGTAEHLKAVLPAGSKYQIEASKMADEIEGLIGLSEKLLLLSKADAQIFGQGREDFDLSSFFSELAGESLSYHTEISVSEAIEPQLIWHCNQQLARQLIHNLYTNAVKYNIPQGWIKFRLHRDSKGFELSLENPTTDIPEDLSLKAFDRFYRADEARNRHIEGLGLGLSICKEIAEVHQATLSLEVTPHSTIIARLRAPCAP